jgi:hypothetical protein
VKTARLLAVATLITLAAAVPLAAQVNDTYVIPGAARANGLFGTRWLTQLSIFNPQPYTLRVVVIFMPTGGGVGDEVALDIPSNSLAFTDDLIGDVFGVNGVTGALLVATFPEDNPGVPNEVIARSFLVTSNTYNDSVNGTYSQTIPGVWSGLQDYASDEISAVAHGVRHYAREGWRTNIGAVNLGRRSVTMRVKIFDMDGGLISTVPFVVPPLGHMLDQLPVEVNGGSLEFFVDDPSEEAVVFPAVSTIDQLSGDPRYQAPTLLASASILFGKAAHRAELGKRIDTTIARRVRENARSLGVVQLKREANGHRMVR